MIEKNYNSFVAQFKIFHRRIIQSTLSTNNEFSPDAVLVQIQDHGGGSRHARLGNARRGRGRRHVSAAPGRVGLEAERLSVFWETGNKNLSILPTKS